MNDLLHSELFALLLTIGTYLVARKIYEKFNLSLLNPLLTSIVFIIGVLTVLDIDYETYRAGSEFIHFLLGPSVVALGYVLYEKSKYLKGNIVSILSSVFVGAVVGVGSVILIGKMLGISDEMIITVEPKSVTTPIAMLVSAKAGGIPSLTAVIVVCVGVFGNIAGPVLLRVLGIHSKMAKGLAMGSAAHGLGTAAAIQMGAVEGAISGLAIGLMGVMTAICLPLMNWLFQIG